jgi:hypothetical protein
MYVWLLITEDYGGRSHKILFSRYHLSPCMKWQFCVLAHCIHLQSSQHIGTIGGNSSHLWYMRASSMFEVSSALNREAHLLWLLIIAQFCNFESLSVVYTITISIWIRCDHLILDEPFENMVGSEIDGFTFHINGIFNFISER